MGRKIGGKIQIYHKKEGVSVSCHSQLNAGNNNRVGLKRQNGLIKIGGRSKKAKNGVGLISTILGCLVQKGFTPTNRGSVLNRHKKGVGLNRQKG